MTLLDLFLILIAVISVTFFLLSKKLSQSSDWQATVTPLASIMGSGFLVSAPLLAGSVGNYAVLCMAVLLTIAFWIGSAVRYNIQYFEPIAESGRGALQLTGWASRIILSVAYLISITYYLKLLAAFLLSSLGLENEVIANLISSALLIFIAAVGIIKGIGLLEKIERYAVSFNLSVIVALIAALAYFNITQLTHNQWHLPDLWPNLDWDNTRILLGLLIVVQGFETSRYIGDKHPADQRIRTMKYAQAISSFIYIVFLGLITTLFHDGISTDVTGIITMVAPIALALPIMLSFAAMGSQFSAAVADNAGAGGLIEELSLNKLSLRSAYALILFLTLALTWLSNVNEVIAYASRAFALYYFSQCLIALGLNYNNQGAKLKTLSFTGAAIISLIVFLFGIPAE